MPKISKSSKKKLKKFQKTYVPKDTEKYMCEKHLIFFKIKLHRLEKRISKSK